MTNLGPNFSTRPALKIDLGAIKDNYRALQKKVGASVKVAASVKADGYGLGSERVGKALYGAGCRNYFVATAGEGKILRNAIGDNASIYILNGPAPRDLTLFFGARLKPVINSTVQARIWADAIEGVNSVPYSAIHIDTGMNRLGFSQDELEKLIKNKTLLKSLNHEFVMSHLAWGPDKSHPMNAQQLKAFRQAAARLPMGPLSLANTAGIYLGKNYHFQMVRPGIGLYGGQATNDKSQEVSRPVVSLMAAVLQVRHVKAGETIGYDATYTAKTDMSVAVVGAGYADGIPISTSGTNDKPGGSATLSGQRVPIVGRVSMDLTILDVTGLRKQPRIGDWASFRGETLGDDAREAGTIDYELLVRLGQRCRRIYD